jgi:4-hydroxy-tetrahydrodipicolinate synthase
MDWTDVRADFVGPNNVMGTPFISGTEVDYEAIRRHTRYLIEHGLVKGKAVLIPNGSGSECYAMRLEESKRVIEVVCDEAAGRIPIVPGASQDGTDKTIELAKHARACGARAIMLLPTYYVTPSDEVTYRHYATVADAVDLGIMIYDSKHVKDMSFDLLERLATIPNVVAIKANDPSLHRAMRTVEQFGDRWAVVTGMAELYYPFQYQIGAVGFTTGMPNFAPEISVEMYEAVLAQDWPRCMDLRERIMPAMNSIMALSEGPSFKVPMWLLGILESPGAYRLPSMPPSEEQVERFRKALRHMGLNPVN